jgi:hypothetical protein
MDDQNDDMTPTMKGEDDGDDTEKKPESGDAGSGAASTDEGM